MTANEDDSDAGLIVISVAKWSGEAGTLLPLYAAVNQSLNSQARARASGAV